MSRNVWKGLKLLLISLIILNIIWTILLFKNNTNKQNIVDNSEVTTETNFHKTENANNEDSIDVLDLPDQINSWNLSRREWQWFFVDNKRVNRPLLYKSHDATFVQLSPSHKKLGFFFRPDDHSLGEIVLAVLDIDEKVVKELYRGDTWTSNWEWKGDEAVIVKRSCGTRCMNAYVVDIITGEKVDTYRVY